MTAAALVADLRARGVEIVADGDRLRCRPASALTQQDLEILRDQKPAVLALLRGRAPSPPLVCFCCHERRFWRSIYSQVICGTCHPPACEAVVAEWLDPAPGAITQR